MGTLNRLAEQHILESESHLRHIDELMARARQAKAGAPAASTDAGAVLERIKVSRDKLARDLDELRQAHRSDGSHDEERGAEVKGLLASLGLQVEAALRAIVESDTNS